MRSRVSQDMVIERSENTKIKAPLGNYYVRIKFYKPRCFKRFSHLEVVVNEIGKHLSKFRHAIKISCAVFLFYNLAS